MGVAIIQETQQINIPHASMLTTQCAIEALSCIPERLLVDGNYYDPYPDEVEYRAIVKGDNRYPAIATASILAKMHRDEHMTQQALRYPYYGWEQNKDYSTAQYREGIRQHSFRPSHR